MGAFVQAPSALETSGTSAAFGAITVGAGNLLVVGIRIGANTTVSVSDDKSNVWAQADGLQNDADGDSVFIYYAKNCASGSTTVTVTPGTSASIRASLFEISGENTSTPLDQHTNADTGTAVTTKSSGNIISTSAGMWIGLLSNATDITGVACSALGTAAGTIPTGGTTTKSAMAYHNETGTTTNPATFTWTNAQAAFCAVANFKDAAGGSFKPYSLPIIGVGMALAGLERLRQRKNKISELRKDFMKWKHYISRATRLSYS